MNIKIRASQEAFNFGIGIMIYDDSGDHLCVGRDITMEVVEKNECVGHTTTIDHTAAQLLMDSLWDCGIRPTEGSGSAGAMAATERHLKDMQSLVFKGRK